MVLNSESGRIYEISNSSKQNKDKKKNYYFVFSGKTDEDTITASHDGALPLWTPFEVKDNREESLGTIEWDGGPVKGGWLLKKEGVKELRLKEKLGVIRYIGKLIINLLPGKFYTTHTRNMYLFDSDEKLYGFLLHKGTWFNPSYEFVYTREAEELFGKKLLYALCGLNAVANV